MARTLFGDVYRPGFRKAGTVLLVLTLALLVAGQFAFVFFLASAATLIASGTLMTLAHMPRKASGQLPSARRAGLPGDFTRRPGQRPPMLRSRASLRRLQT